VVAAVALAFSCFSVALAAVSALVLLPGSVSRGAYCTGICASRQPANNVVSLGTLVRSVELQKGLVTGVVSMVERDSEHHASGRGAGGKSYIYRRDDAVRKTLQCLLDGKCSHSGVGERPSFVGLAVFVSKFKRKGSREASPNDSASLDLVTLTGGKRVISIWAVPLVALRTVVTRIALAAVNSVCISGGKQHQIRDALAILPTVMARRTLATSAGVSVFAFAFAGRCVTSPNTRALFGCMFVSSLEPVPAVRALPLATVSATIGCIALADIVGQANTGTTAAVSTVRIRGTDACCYSSQNENAFEHCPQK